MAQNYYAELFFHFIWRTKNRQALITPDLEPAIWAKILSKSTELGAYPLEVGGIEDHVHQLVNTPPTLLLSEFIGTVKGSVSHYVNHDLHSAQRFHWGEGCGVLSLAKRDAPGVRSYIRNQRPHHIRKTCNAKMERCNQTDA